MSASDLGFKNSNSSTVSIRQILELAWPIVVSMLSQTVLGILDVMLVGGLGTTAIAAAGLGTTMSFVLLAFGNGLIGGVKVVAAQRFGAGDREGAERLSFQVLHLALALGTAVALLAPLAPSFVFALGGSPEASAMAGPFLAIRLLGAPLLFASTGLGGWMQGRGDTRSAMIATLLQHGTFLLLDGPLLYGLGPIPALGVPGAAIAGVCGWAAALSFLIFRSRGVLLRVPRLPDFATLSAVVRVGAPTGVQYLLDVSSFGIFAAMLVRSGEAHLAAHIMAIRIIGVSFLPGYALSEATSVLVGQAVGARSPERARAAWVSGIRVTVGVMFAWALVFAAIPGLLVSIFEPAPEVAALVKMLLYLAAFFQIFDAVATVSYGAMTGAGDTRFAMVSNGLTAWLVKLPLAYFLAIGLGFGAPGAWIALTAEIVVLAVLSLHRIRSGGWLTRPVEAPAVAAVAGA